MLAWGSSANTTAVPFAELTVIARAFTDTVNASGGVNGRVLTVLTCDDLGTDAGAIGCAHQAVERQVAAVIGGYDAHTETALPILASAGIALLETAEPAGAGLRGPIAFPVIGGIPIQVFGAATVAAAHGCTRVAVLTEDGLYPGALAALVRTALGDSGAVLAGEYRLTGAPDDLDPVLAEATRSSDCLLIAAGPQSTGRGVGAIEANRYPQRIFLIGAGDPGQVVQRYPELADRVLAIDPCPPLSDPVWRRYLDALASAPDGATVEAGGVAQRASWAAFEVFLQIGRRMITFDAASVRAALRTTGPVDAGGMLPPIEFGRDSVIPAMPRLVNPNITVQGFRHGRLERLTPGFTDLGPALARAATPSAIPSR